MAVLLLQRFQCIDMLTRRYVSMHELAAEFGQVPRMLI